MWSSSNTSGEGPAGGAEEQVASRAGACDVVAEGREAGCRALRCRRGAVGPAVPWRGKARSHRRRRSAVRLAVWPVAATAQHSVEGDASKGAEKGGYRIGTSLGTRGRRGLEGEFRGPPYSRG